MDDFDNFDDLEWLSFGSDSENFPQDNAGQRYQKALIGSYDNAYEMFSEYISYYFLFHTTQIPAAKAELDFSIEENKIPLDIHGEHPDLIASLAQKVYGKHYTAQDSIRAAHPYVYQKYHYTIPRPEAKFDLTMDAMVDDSNIPLDNNEPYISQIENAVTNNAQSLANIAVAATLMQLNNMSGLFFENIRTQQDGSLEFIAYKQRNKNRDTNYIDLSIYDDIRRALREPIIFPSFEALEKAESVNSLYPFIKAANDFWLLASFDKRTASQQLTKFCDGWNATKADKMTQIIAKGQLHLNAEETRQLLNHIEGLNHLHKVVKKERKNIHKIFETKPAFKPETFKRCFRQYLEGFVVFVDSMQKFSSVNTFNANKLEKALTIMQGAMNEYISLAWGNGNDILKQAYARSNRKAEIPTQPKAVHTKKSLRRLSNILAMLNRKKKR